MKTALSIKLLLLRTLTCGIAALLTVASASAVQVSASSNAAVGPSNHMALPPAPGIFDPGTPDFGFAGLAAPGAGTNSVIIPFAYPGNAPNAGNAVQMYGDAVATITNLGAGSFQLEVILTNFWMNQGSPLPTQEYVYLNVWETFTNLGLPSNLTWSTSGSISINGQWAAAALQFVAIEPIAIAYDPSLTSWDNVSPFFGANGTGPGNGPLISSAPVSSLTPYVSGGQLTVGMQTILLMNDPGGIGGASMHLPTSLHLSMTLTPVPVPEPSSLALLASAGCGALIFLRRRYQCRRSA